MLGKNAKSRFVKKWIVIEINFLLRIYLSSLTVIDLLTILN